MERLVRNDIEVWQLNVIFYHSEIRQPVLLPPNIFTQLLGMLVSLLLENLVSVNGQLVKRRVDQFVDHFHSPARLVELQVHVSLDEILLHLVDLLVQTVQLQTLLSVTFLVFFFAYEFRSKLFNAVFNYAQIHFDFGAEAIVIYQLLEDVRDLLPYDEELLLAEVDLG